ncbi:MAG: hypothetical protein K2Q01_09550 [Rickettsiales bacterium]|nr:hypothetical protein [Rickettsiales bacterium]
MATRTTQNDKPPPLTPLVPPFRPPDEWETYFNVGQPREGIRRAAYTRLEQLGITDEALMRPLLHSVVDQVEHMIESHDKGSDGLPLIRSHLTYSGLATPLDKAYFLKAGSPKPRTKGKPLHASAIAFPPGSIAYYQEHAPNGITANAAPFEYRHAPLTTHDLHEAIVADVRQAALDVAFQTYGKPDPNTLNKGQWALLAWKTIRPEVDKAIHARMHALKVPNAADQRNAYNHYHNTAMAVTKSMAEIFFDDYFDTITNLPKKLIPAEESAQAYMLDQYRWLAETVASYGKIDGAHVGKLLAAQVVSQFTENSSRAEQQKLLVHLVKKKQAGPTEEDLTLLKLEEEFVKNIEKAGVDVLMLYLKEQFALKGVELKKPRGVNIPEKPPLPGGVGNARA